MEFRDIMSETYDAVLRCLYRSLLPEKSSKSLRIGDHGAINKEFKFLTSIRSARTNTFITKQNLRAGNHSLFVGNSSDIQDKPTRISRILNSFLEDATDSISSARRAKAPKDAFVMHFQSPYGIVARILTDPDAVETKEVAQFFAKIELMEYFNVDIDLSRAGVSAKEKQNVVSFSDLDQFYTTLEKYIQARDSRGPISTLQAYLSELFALYGLLTVRVELSLSELSDLKVVEGQSIDTFKSYLFEKSEYKRSTSIVSLPSIAELANIVFGIPIAISGFSELICRGLRQGAGEGTVTLLRGGAGSGKTTLSISIQRAVEALGIPTIFMSSEESRAALVARRESVLNLSQKSHSSYVSESASFEILDTVSVKKENNKEEPGIFDLVQALADKLENTERGVSKIGQFARLFLVIDGIHNYIKDEHKDDIRRLIDLCRRTNTHVLITSSDEWAHSEGIEYFVDNYFSLSSRAIREPMPHVRRELSILKTRHQSSLVGEHFMRFQDEGDLLFTPNFSEILKSHSKSTVLGPDKKIFSKPFSSGTMENSSRKTSSRLLDLEHYDRSVTLVYGRGSASKTSLCLRLLASPNIEGRNSEKRILVVSFLSPDSYYQQKKRSFISGLENDLRTQLALRIKCQPEKISKEDLDESFPEWNNVELETLSFTPGMITAEEVYSAVASKIGNADVGAPRFSGVLFDGLHNVFVQFPLLETHPELWSALLNLVRRVGVKSVSTFTDFEVWGARTLTTVDYENTRAKPLLVALSQSIDYGFGLVPVNQVGDNRTRESQGDLFKRNNPGLFILSSFMAHSQASATDYLMWDRANETISLPV